MWVWWIWSTLDDTITSVINESVRGVDLTLRSLRRLQFGFHRITNVFLLLHPTLNVKTLCISMLSQTPLIGSAGSSVTAKEPISRWHWPPPPPLFLPPGPKRRLHPGTRHSCRHISLPLSPLTAQPANPDNPPALKMNVEGLLKWMGEGEHCAYGGEEAAVFQRKYCYWSHPVVLDVNRSNLRFFWKCLIVASIIAESDTSLTILDLMQRDGGEWEREAGRRSTCPRRASGSSVCCCCDEDDGVELWKWSVRNWLGW